MCIWKLCLLFPHLSVSNFSVFSGLVTPWMVQPADCFSIYSSWKCVPCDFPFHFSQTRTCSFSFHSFCACFAVFSRKKKRKKEYALPLEWFGFRVPRVEGSCSHEHIFMITFWEWSFLMIDTHTYCLVLFFLSVPPLHCTWTLPGFHVHVSNPNPEGVDRSNARYNVSNGREGGPVRRHLFYFLPPCCHAGELSEHGSTVHR